MKITERIAYSSIIDKYRIKKNCGRSYSFFRIWNSVVQGITWNNKNTTFFHLLYRLINKKCTVSIIDINDLIPFMKMVREFNISIFCVLVNQFKREKVIRVKKFL